MIKQKGWAGSQKSRRQIAVRLSRIEEGQSTAWIGKTVEGNLDVHVGYYHGVISVDVRLPAKGISVGWTWQSVATFRPALVEAESADGNDSYSRRLIAEQQITREMRSANRSAMDRLARQAELIGLAANDPARKDLMDTISLSGPIVRDGQLARWFHLRNENLDRLSREANTGDAEIQIWLS